MSLPTTSENHNNNNAVSQEKAEEEEGSGAEKTIPEWWPDPKESIVRNALLKFDSLSSASRSPSDTSSPNSTPAYATLKCKTLGPVGRSVLSYNTFHRDSVSVGQPDRDEKVIRPQQEERRKLQKDDHLSSQLSKINLSHSNNPFNKSPIHLREIPALTSRAPVRPMTDDEYKKSSHSLNKVELPAMKSGDSGDKNNSCRSLSLTSAPRKSYSKRSSSNAERQAAMSSAPATVTLLDKVIPITEEMFRDPSKHDPLVFAFDRKETPENVIYMSASDKEMVDYNKEFPAIKAAVLEKLILGLTPEGYSDPDFIFTFLINMPSFTTPARVLSLLKLRWNIPFPDHQQPNDKAVAINFETFQKRKLFPIRLRIFNVIKLWLEDHQKLINEETKSLIREFVTETMARDLPGPTTLLLRIIQSMGEHNDEDVMFNQQPPKPFFPVHVKLPLTLLSIHPEELVRQITLLDSTYFRKIKLHEFLGSGWTKPDKERRSPNILIMINSFNNMSRWVATEILRHHDVKHRAHALNFFICVAQKFYEYHNFNGIMEVISALQNSAIHRLYSTWDMLPNKSWEIFNHLSTLMNSNAGEGNYYTYRVELEKTIPPIIPYLGVHLTDLIFLNDGNRDFVDEEKKMINWYKMSKIARVVRSMAIKQQAPYCLSIVYPILKYIIESPLMSDEEQYKLSLQFEKRVPKSQRVQTSKATKRIKVDFRAYNIDV